ncbi:MAG: B12-binding domain-containing protein [Planctomycetota bacterium]
MRNVLSPKEVALAIGVSESSLKRWADGGRLRVRRTAGGHRRISIQEAIRFARENGFPVVRPDILDLPEIGRHRPAQGQPIESLNETIYQKLQEGQAEEVRAILLELYLAGRPLSDVFDGPVRSAMQRIGEKWRHTDAGIYIEHRATDICIQAVTMIRSLVTGGEGHDDRQANLDAPVAIGGCPANDPYILPSLMVATVLADMGFREVNLGPETPIKSMIAAAKHYRPKVTWLSCSVVDAAPSRDELVALAHTVADWDGIVTLGGQGTESLPPVDVTGVRQLPTLAMLVNAVREFAPAQPAAGEGRGSRSAGSIATGGAGGYDFEIID